MLTAGCSLTQKPVIDNSPSNQSALLSQEQANNLNVQVQDLNKQNSELLKENEAIKTNLANQNSNSSTVPNQINMDWLPFKSSYFTLSFKVPSGFEVKETQNHILVAKSPYYTREIGDDNSFLFLNRYDELNTRESMITSYKKSLKNWKESQVIIDGSSFLTIKGTDIGSFEGDSAGQIIAVFFNASWLQITERPANKDQDFDPIAIGNDILSTLKFSK
jgi:hypothetical protein